MIPSPGHGREEDGAARQQEALGCAEIPTQRATSYTGCFNHKQARLSRGQALVCACVSWTFTVCETSLSPTRAKGTRRPSHLLTDDSHSSIGHIHVHGRPVLLAGRGHKTFYGIVQGVHSCGWMGHTKEKVLKPSVTLKCGSQITQAQLCPDWSGFFFWGGGRPRQDGSFEDFIAQKKRKASFSTERRAMRPSRDVAYKTLPNQTLSPKSPLARVYEQYANATFF